MRLFLAVSASLMIAGLPARAEKAKPIKLLLPEHDWQLEITAAGFAVNGVDLSRDGKRVSVRAAGGKGMGRFGLSAFAEVLPEAKDAKGCRAFYAARQDEWAKKNKAELKTTRRKNSEKGKQARSVYFIEEFRGEVVHQKHVNAYLRKDDACIDVHLSALHYEPADAKIFEKVLMSLRWTDPSKGESAWMATMINGASLAERGDNQGAIRAYREAQAAALKDPKATDMDLAMLEKALGETYLALDDAKNADPALRAAAKVLTDDPSVLFNLACSSSMLGRIAEADRAIKACFAAAQAKGRLERYVRMTGTDSQLKAYRASPEFAALVRESSGR